MTSERSFFGAAYGHGPTGGTTFLKHCPSLHRPAAIGSLTTGTRRTSELGRPALEAKGLDRCRLD